MTAQTALGVIGNISRDQAAYPDGRRYAFVGGAALQVALGAARSGLAAAPIAVIGHDLAWILHDPRLQPLDLRKVAVADGASCSFAMTYDPSDRLQTIDCDFGVAATLTAHALRVLEHDHAHEQPGGQSHDHYHVCCRRPLDASRVLGRLVKRRLPFSVDVIASSAPTILAAVRPFLPHTSVVFVNAEEYRQLAAIADPASVPMVVVTDGPRPVRLLAHGRPVAWVQPPPAKARGIEVTGAGDTLAGAFLATWLGGAAPPVALRAAVMAANASLTEPIRPIRPAWA